MTRKYFFLFFAFIFLLPFHQTAFAKAYKIGFLVDTQNAQNSLLLKELQTQIINVVGEDAQIVFPKKSLLSNGYDLEVAKQQYNQLIQDDTDIIIAFGLVNNDLISKLDAHKKPTILFGRANEAFSGLDFKRKTSGIKNFTYLVEAESYTNDLKKL